MTNPVDTLAHLQDSGEFIRRHIGPDAYQTVAMLEALKVGSVAELIDRTVPASIRCETTRQLQGPLTEQAALAELKSIASGNRVFKSYLGQGYYDTYIPNVILRNVLENPGWYTAYTPYQPEI